MRAQFERVAGFETDLDGRALLRSSIDATGRPLLVATSPAQHATAVGPAAPDGAFSGAPYPLTVLLGSESGWERHDLEGTFVAPHVQPLPGGHLLVAGTYSRRTQDGEAEANAAVYAPDGRVVRRFLLGDGIDDIQATAAGELWVSYFYEGVMGDYGRLGWGRLSPDEWVDPVGVSGLVCFDENGEVLFEFAPPSGLHVMADCYALNVSGGEAWASYHPYFPLVRIDASRRVDGWATGPDHVIGALAVTDDRVLLSGERHHGDHRWWSGRLEGTEVRDLVELDPVLGDGTPIASLERVIGRGTVLHAFSASAYYRLDVNDVR